MARNPELTDLEWQEVRELLDKKGYADLVDALLDPALYKRSSGGINKAALGRRLGWKPKEVEVALAICRRLLEDDWADF